MRQLGKDSSDLSEATAATVSVVLAQLAWGLQPLFWILLRGIDAAQTVAHRVVWSFLFAAAVAAVFERRSVRHSFRDRTGLRRIAVAGMLISLNWGLYVYAVLSDRIVEAALGLFLMPLATVVAGVIFLREKLRPAQWISVGLGLVAVAVMAAGYGRVPWLALSMAVSVAFYSLIKKHVAYTPMTGLALEVALPAVAAGAFLIYLQFHGGATFGHAPWQTTLLLACTGAVSAVPLAFFAFALQRVPLTLVGIAQYINPVLQLMVGVLVAHEPVTGTRWMGFCLVWAALVTFTVEGLLHRRRSGPGAARAETDSRQESPATKTAMGVRSRC